MGCGADFSSGMSRSSKKKQKLAAEGLGFVYPALPPLPIYVESNFDMSANLAYLKGHAMNIQR
jgi:hypothetical protein